MSKFNRSYEEINERIKSGKAIVLTAEEFKEMSKEQGVKEAGRKVDVVTTGTFSPMCSSGAFINFGHSDPPIKMSKVWLNDVPAYGGLAAVDSYIGATELAENKKNLYGGAHVIEDIVRGKKIRLRAMGAKTDCYPREYIETWVDKDTLNECTLFNPRNVYQNYGAATNSTDRVLYTYMGTLLPNFGNIAYCTAGELSPLINDPKLRSIGIGTKIFLGGAKGYIAWNGTQYNPDRQCLGNDTPVGPARTLSLIGNLKAMDPAFIKAATFHKYGVSLFVGVGIPIPVLDEEMAEHLSVGDWDIKTSLTDYGIPRRDRPTLRTVSYGELKSGSVKLHNREVPSSPLSSLYKARRIAQILKGWIIKGELQLHPPIDYLPERGTVKPLREGGHLVLRTKKSKVQSVTVDDGISIKSEECVHCGACTGVCTAGALRMTKPDWKLVFKREKCTLCGLCATACPLGIINVMPKRRYASNE